MALAAVVFGNYTPIGVTWARLLVFWHQKRAQVPAPVAWYQASPTQFLVMLAVPDHHP